MEELVQKLADLEEEEVQALVKAEIEAGADPLQLFDACRQGMVVVGERYEAGEYYVSDLMLAAEIFKQVTAMLEPKMAGAVTETKGTVVVGTVKGDLHDIGKDLVVAMLRASGFDVHDLGVNVEPDAFVGALKETDARVLGLSGLLTIAFDAMKATVEALDEAGLRSSVKVMVGGGPVDETACKYAGADAWGDSAQAAVDLATTWMEA